MNCPASFTRVDNKGMFHVSEGVARSVVELRLSSCSLLTSEALEHLSSFRKLEVLDTSGCERIGDQAPFYISKFTTLTRLNLAKARITDVGLALLGAGDLPILQLFCNGVTDAAVQMLMDRPNHNSSQLQLLDLCSCRGLSAEAIMLPLPQHAFHRLRWLGIGLADIVAKRGIFTAICEARPRLVVCGVCCDFGCCDG
ncbi:hypothetical protein CQW23_33403 [Capsicum baccatum]|uniref:F-box/LRR-repeat protein 15-like leucin rich repeat domain-containing protein n=1 Tax=Capsicum baccatum TaxID=33114 RepID=A0A2G2V1Y6_CAPBA|nr:hypothetical protein CQW23_33403 [Capsicum baccatum]